MLQGRYDFKTAEPRLQALWTEERIYEFDPASTGRAYTVDTPPPTVSGQIHIGHVYSYTHADVVARYHRMKGERVFYPFGFDDNGLPTERFTENVKGIRAREVGRSTFIEACLSLSEEVETRFEVFWKRLGLSVDWRLRYSSIDPRSRRVSQAAFIDLYEKGLVYRQEAPTLWCPHDRTAVAQADVEDKEGVAAAFVTIPFAVDDGRELRIATTRPELLPACVAVFVHPEDERYSSLVGRRATTPLFPIEVPILADEEVDSSKGTGAVMCCTFGDLTDVGWWRKYDLPLRTVLTEDGRMNELPYAGMPVKQARARILEDLGTAGKVVESQAIEHTVGVHDRCGTEVEYLVASQWFVRLLESKESFLEAGRRIRWHPEHMRTRYENWVTGLNWDWNITRQRYYGVPFPVWYCEGCGEPVVASREALPVDPQETAPEEGRCPDCGGTALRPDTDVMDTWATSSVTPQICGTLLEELGITEEEFDKRYRPMSLRPNAHDIIRTWDFYTVVRSLYLNGELPWTDVMISGHALDPGGKKISKSKLKAAADPTDTLETLSADAVRYWATSVRTGADTLLNDEVMKNGNRLVTKLWNAAKLILPHLDGYGPPPVPPPGLNATDRWLLARLHSTITQATAAMEEYEYAAAKAVTERFFWTDLCDNYLELVKFRLYEDHDGEGAAAREGALYTLSHALLSVLKLLAPFLPHITDEIYSAGFTATDGARSIHVSRWPEPHTGWVSPDSETAGQALLEVVETVRRWKADRHLSVGAPIHTVRLSAPPGTVDALRGAAVDLRSVTRAERVEISAGVEGEAIEVTVEGEPL